MKGGDTMTETDRDVRVVTYASTFAPHFARLNLEWIEDLFEVEPRDRSTLEHPEETIMDQGGEIFFVVEDDEPVGTVAMRPIDGGYELEKMAVTGRVRGRGYGDRLMVAALTWARSMGAGRVVLHSNTSLEPAIRLYRKYGFGEVATDGHAGWERCDITMQLDLSSERPHGHEG